MAPLCWLSSQLWRHRVTGLLVTLVVTCLLILLTAQSLRKPNRYVEYREHISRAGHSGNRATRGHPDPTPPRGAQGQTQGVKGQNHRDRNGFTVQRTRRSLPPIAFIKTHKTGSSTVQNILFRLGEKESSTFAFPYYTYQFSYPDKFKAEFVDELPAGSSQFDLLCSHLRMDLTQLRQVMPHDTIYVTLLRDPLRTFESVFSYYTSIVPAFTHAKIAAATTNKKSALSVFLEAPESFWDPQESGNGLARNPMTFDLGLSSLGWNASWPSDLAALEEALHLVMVAEHFDESLVLLGALLRLEPEELAYVRLNTRADPQVTPLNAEMQARLRAWNRLDVLLYDFFLQVFWEKVELFGKEKLKQEVSLLRASTERIKQRCVSRAGVPPGDLEDLVRPWQTDTVTITGYELKGNLTQLEQGFCVRLVLPELQYHAHLYFQQYGRDMRSVPTD